jgi:hypothetical protein
LGLENTYDAGPLILLHLKPAIHPSLREYGIEDVKRDGKTKEIVDLSTAAAR